MNSEKLMYFDATIMGDNLSNVHVIGPPKRLDILGFCRNITKERKHLILRNILLQKKLSEYFKKKKDEGIYNEGNRIFNGLEDSDLLYEKNLSIFAYIIEKSKNEKVKMNSESKHLNQKWNEAYQNLKEEVDSLLKAELIYGNGLLKFNSGKILQEKEVSPLINRHEQVIEDLNSILLKYVTVKDAKSEREMALKDFEEPGFISSLITYELLCLEKLEMQKRLEECNSELGHLNKNIEIALVSLSNLKKKVSSYAELMERKLKHLNECNHLLQMSLDKRAMQRKQSSKLKNEIKIMQQESGLLVSHNLLRDFNNIVLQIDDLKCQEIQFWPFARICRISGMKEEEWRKRFTSTTNWEAEEFVRKDFQCPLEWI